MKKNIIYIIGVALMLTGCNFLDKEPDLRTDIDTQKKVRLLLTSAYEMPNIGPMGETSSDNMVDNNTPDSEGHVNTKVPMSQMYNEYFAWEDVKSDSQQDSPYYIWQGCYSNIAVANQALEAIKALEEKGINCSAEKAEALIIRAYNHFVLVNVFCQAYKDEVASQQDLGVHYMTEAEKTVKPEYSRGSVAEVYRCIEQDLNEALPYIADDYYKVPKYHFNVKAANAFAARFYLFKRDYQRCIECANKVLGVDSEAALSMMWNAAKAKLQGNSSEEANVWIDPADNGNLLITTTMSVQQYAWIPDYARYTLNRAPRDYTINTGEVGGGPCWSDNFPLNFWRYDANYGGFLCKIKVFFEYTDKVAGIGFGHTMRREFTAGETLLCRAEAKAMLGNTTGAIEDLDIWAQGYNCDRDVTLTRLQNYYAAGGSAERQAQLIPELHCADMNAEWGAQYAQANKEVIWCCLHLRRVENMHDGTRWFDIKRYGIELKHEIGNPVVTKTLIWNDDRRAIQLPQEAILAGQQPNPRVILGDKQTAPQQSISNAPSHLQMYTNSLQYPLTLAGAKN